MKKLFLLFSFLQLAACNQSSSTSEKPATSANLPNVENPTNNTANTSTTQTSTTQTNPTQSHDDHQVGNGGAGLCVATNCLTLSEAGLRIASPTEEYYQLSPTTVRALQNVADRLPIGEFKKNIINLTIGTGKTFKVLDVDDPAKLEIIRERYAKALAQYSPSIRMEDVNIFAFAGYCNFTEYYSSNYCTYLLPDFFKLSGYQQAKILIHEANVRNDIKPDKFVSALELDGMIEDLLENPNFIDDSHFRIDRWVELLQAYGERDLNGQSNKTSFNLWLYWLQKNKSVVFELNKITHEKKEQIEYSFKLDLAMINSNFEIPPAFARILNTQNYIATEMFDKSSITKSELEQICYQHLTDKNSLDFLYSYRNQNLNYELLKISCSLQNGSLTASQNLCKFY